MVPTALKGFDCTDMTNHPELAGGAMCCAKPGVFHCVYLPQGGAVSLSGLTHSLPIYWFNPKTGATDAAVKASGPEYKTSAPNNDPWILLVGVRKNH